MTPPRNLVDEERSLPDFSSPPIVELALGVQFKPIHGLRPIDLGPLRDRWRDAYPVVQEQPAIPPGIEQAAVSPPTVQFTVGPPLQMRLWFVSSNEEELVQIQHDRLSLNWRRTSDTSVYPRFPALRARFAERLAEVSGFVTDRDLGRISLTQVEVNYVNKVGPAGEGPQPLDALLQNWMPMKEHHLGDPVQAQLAMVFDAPGVGKSPVRLHVGVSPAIRADGQTDLIFTLTLRGAPNGDTAEAAMSFMDEAHNHLVRSFAELTSTSMHREWGRVQ